MVARLALIISLLTLFACQKQDPFELVDLSTLDPTIQIDLIYASDQNFIGKTVYSVRHQAILRRDAAERLVNAHHSLQAQGYGIKVLDAYRPLSVQRVMWQVLPDSRYVANPETGSRHNRGCAVDVTLVDSTGQDVEMPTPIDDFSEKAASDYMNLPEHILENRARLQHAMTEAGFTTIQTEWWHFDAPGWESCDLLDVPLEEILESL
jgi:D-alanyl-D-alanine dipeptidase